MTDMGAGVYEHGYPDPEPGTVPTCPYCGVTGDATDIGHVLGRYFCSCGSLFWGSDSEWRRLAMHRRMAAERKTLPPLKLVVRPTPRRDK